MVTKRRHSPKSAEEIEKISKKVLAEAGVGGPPVDPIAIAAKHGIRIHNAEFEDESVAGLIHREGDEVLMLVRNNDSPFRKRFTIAHELGHYFLHDDDPSELVVKTLDLFRDTETSGNVNEYDLLEVQANRFAAALLMPEEQLRKIFVECKSLSELAVRFNVSEEAMGIRLVRLGLTGA